MRWKTTDSKTKATIIEEKLNNPDLSNRDIAIDVGVSHDTVNRVVNTDLRQAASKSEKIAAFIDSNDRLISIGQNILETYIPAVEIEWMGDLNSLSSILERAYKQNQLSEGKPTDRIEFDTSKIKSMTDEELNNNIFAIIKE